MHSPIKFYFSLSLVQPKENYMKECSSGELNALPPEGEFFNTVICTRKNELFGYIKCSKYITKNYGLQSKKWGLGL